MNIDQQKQLWYVAFGSNTVPEMLGRYVPVDDIEHRAVTIPHELYFAGKAWGAAPAFVEHVSDEHVTTPHGHTVSTRTTCRTRSNDPSRTSNQLPCRAFLTG